MAHDFRDYQQSLLDGREGVFEVFQLKSKSSMEIIGIELKGLILYFIKNPKRNHMGYVIGVLPDNLQVAAERVSELSKGYFDTFANSCKLWAQYMKDGKDLRFDRTAIVNVDGKWQFFKSITYYDVDETWFKIISSVGTEFCESISQLCDEIHAWNGFSTGDCIKASFSDMLSGYRKIRKYTSLSRLIQEKLKIL